MMTTLLTPQPSPPKNTFPHLLISMMASAVVHKGILGYYIYMCSMIIEQDNQQKIKIQMVARNDFHWLRFLPISVYHICLFCLQTSSVIIYNVHSKQSLCGSKDLWSLVLSLVLALFPSLDCDLRCLLFQSSDLQTHWEWGISKLCGISLPRLTETPSFPLVFFSLSLRLCVSHTLPVYRSSDCAWVLVLLVWWSVSMFSVSCKCVHVNQWLCVFLAASLSIRCFLMREMFRRLFVLHVSLHPLCVSTVGVVRVLRGVGEACGTAVLS